MAILDEEGKLVAVHYAQTWNEFIGQDAAKQDVQTRIGSALKRGTGLDHMLLASPHAGIGKTNLALLTSVYMGVKIQIESDIAPAQLPYLFMDLKDGDILFLDEIHRMFSGGAGAKARAEWLLQYLQDGILVTPQGTQYDPPKVTIIAATTDAGRIPRTVLDRFLITPTLHPYSNDDAALIALQMSQRILVSEDLAEPTVDVACRIATAAGNSPRIIRKILVAIRDLVTHEQVEENGGDYDLKAALNMAGVDADGLTEQARRYLTIMLRDFHGLPVGQQQLTRRLGEVGHGMGGLEDQLLNLGLLAFTRQGRQLTPAGMRRARQLVA